MKFESMRAFQCMRDILDNSPIFACLSGTIDRFVNFDYATLCSCHGAFILLVQRPRKNNVGEARRVVEEEINRHVELEFLESAPDKVIVRQRDDGIERDRKQSANFVAIDLPDYFVSVHAGFWQFFGVYAPDTRNVCPMLRVADLPHAWQLIAFLAVLAPTLTVPLPGDRRVTAAFASNTPGCE